MKSFTIVAGLTILLGACSTVKPSPEIWLDATFGGGKIVTTVGSQDTQGSTVTLQSDGKILVAGSNYVGAAIARYTSSGALDVTFGMDGKINTPNTFSVKAAAVQDDGKIVIAGHFYLNNGQNNNFILSRYHPNGILDTSFDTDGKVITDFDLGDDFCQALVVQNDGKILVIGHTRDREGSSDLVLARYTSSGTLDPTFGLGGKLIKNLGMEIGLGSGFTIQGDGKIVMTGFSFNGKSYDFAMVRYTSTGSLDDTFGLEGIVKTPLSFDVNSKVALTLQGDGKILVAGGTYNVSEWTQSDFAIARYTSTGVLDDTFGVGGKVRTDFRGNRDLVAVVALQSDGKIVVAGESMDASGSWPDFGVARYTSTGTLDSTFGVGGKIITDFGGGKDRATGMVVQKDGKIVVAGTAFKDGYDGFALVRYLP